MSKINVNQLDAHLAGENILINGNFDIWQRGTSESYSVTSSEYDTADRWMMRSTGGSDVTMSQQSFTVGQTDVPNEPKYYLRWDITSWTSGNGLLQQRVEDVRTAADNTVSLSFYAKCDSAQTLNANMLQYFGSSGSTAVQTSDESFSLTTSWQKFEAEFTVASVSGKTISGDDDYLALEFKMPGAECTVDIAQVKLEEGSVATPFVARPFGVELALCKRFYQAGTCNISGVMYIPNGDVRGAGFTFPIEMHHAPAVAVTLSSNQAFGSGSLTGLVNRDLGTPSLFIGTKGFTCSSFSGYSNFSSCDNTAVAIAYRDASFTADAEL